jgi:GTP pyrophosphokinase
VTLARSPRFRTAFTLACDVHADQVRKGTGIPYIAHVLGVAGIALEYGATEDETIAALLHDAVEDGGEARLAEIRATFGDEVGDIVLACSDSLAEDPEDKLPWLERKQAYLAHLATATPSACLVSAADKLHNVRAITRDVRQQGDDTWARFKGGREGTLWYYREVARVLWRRWPSRLTADLRREVDGLLELAESL